MCVCVCVCVRVRACVRACVCVGTLNVYVHSLTCMWHVYRVYTVCLWVGRNSSLCACGLAAIVHCVLVGWPQ